jgi:hypothetical protein
LHGRRRYFAATFFNVSMSGRGVIRVRRGIPLFFFPPLFVLFVDFIGSVVADISAYVIVPVLGIVVEIVMIRSCE